MSALLLIARLVLAAVFAVAGVAKLADREGSRKTLVGFGVPGALAAPAAVALPVAELAVAVLLLPARTAVWGAVGAFGLLAAFTIAIGGRLGRGRTPECHCFGALHPEPAGPQALARNGALAALAAFVVIGGRSAETSATGWIGRLDGTETALLILGIAFVAVAAGGVLAFV